MSCRKFDLKAALTQKSKDTKDRFVVYGVSGIGKSEFAANFKDPLFLCAPGETGIQKLIQSRAVPEIPFVEIRNTLANGVEQHDGVDMLYSALDQIASGEVPCKTVVLDEIGGFVDLMRKETIHTDFKGDDSEKKGGYGNYGAGVEKLLAKFISFFLPRLDAIKDAGITVVVLGHSRTKNIPNPEGADYSKYILSVPDKIGEKLVSWSDMCLFMKSDPILKGVEGFGGKVTYKAVGENRVIRTVDTPSSYGKNRHSLPIEIPMGGSGKEALANLVAAMKEAKEANQNRLNALAGTVPAENTPVNEGK